MRFNYFIFYIFLIVGINSNAQSFLELNRQKYTRVDATLNKLDNPYHTAMKPYVLNSGQLPKVNSDSLDNFYPLHTTYKVTASKFIDWLTRKSFQENLLYADTADFKITFDPLIDFTFTKDNTQNKTLSVFSRGGRIKGKIGDKFAFYTLFYESQALFPKYVENQIFLKNRGVVPGNGKVKPFILNNVIKMDYSMSEGYVSYSPSTKFNVFFGHGKNFIGDGYRSLLLSDNAFNYPFLKFTTNLGIFQYTNIYASYINLGGTNNFDDGYPRKNGSFHYLSVNATKRLQLGLFEGIIWKNTPSRGFDVNYLNPIIFFRPVEFALGSPDNALLGLNAKYKISDNAVLYGQGVIDDLNTQSFKKDETGHLQQKVGGQLGIKLFNLFKINKLNTQLEYNVVRPYVYAHKDSLQSYTHHGQSLAHPLGANFYEVVFITNYTYKNWFIEGKLNYAKIGLDSNNLSYGSNVFRSDLTAVSGVAHPPAKNSLNNPITGKPEFTTNHKLLDGQVNTIVNIDLKLSYILNPATNLNAFVGVQNRTQKNNKINLDDTFIYVGLRTNISNQYFDF